MPKKEPSRAVIALFGELIGMAMPLPAMLGIAGGLPSPERISDWIVAECVGLIMAAGEVLMKAKAGAWRFDGGNCLENQATSEAKRGWAIGASDVATGKTTCFCWSLSSGRG